MEHPGDELFEQPAPSADELRPFLGKVVAFDASGVIRASGESWEDILAKLDQKALENLALMYVPNGALIG